MKTDVKNIRVTAFNQDEMLSNAKRMLEEDNEEDDDSEIYEVKLNVDAEEGQTYEDLEDKVKETRKAIDTHSITIDGTTMITHDAPIIII